MYISKADDYDEYDNNEVISNAYVNDNDCMISMKLIKVISAADDCREDLCRARTYTQENSVVLYSRTVEVGVYLYRWTLKT